MPGRVTPLRKPRSTTHLPLALNPMKSKDVLAVLAERSEAVVPVGAWVEPASPNCKEVPAHSSAYIIEEELKEQQRRKQEALKHFQRQVKYRVNQQISLRKKQQLQKSYEAAEKEGSIAMQSSDRIYLTPKRTSVFPSNLNAAIGSSTLPPSEIVGDTIEDGENHSELFHQAQALSYTMKQARHQLASFKTTAPSKKPENIKINTETRREFPLKTYQDLQATVHYQNFMENQESYSEEISSVTTDEKQSALTCGNQQDFLSEEKNKSVSRVQKVRFQEPFSGRTDEKGREISSVDHQYPSSKFEFQDFIGDQVEQKESVYFRQKLSVGTAERCQENLSLNGRQHLPHRHQRDTCRRRQVCDEDQSGLSTEFQVPWAFQSGVDQEEDKKERQKQYLRYRRLFMDIEREQVKEQKREREQKKKVEKIKKRKEQQRYAEEQRILRMKCQKEPCSREKINDLLAQLQLEEIKGAREKQQQREKEYIRYVEALRAQVQEKMKLYNITLPPLCCCGPDFWDAHPDTCANNCIFYKNHKAYNRALHSVINSSDISAGNSTLRSAIRNFATANRWTLKRISNKNLKSAETTSSISASF
ncbi:coiled-coil domain-containing protein 15 isoform 3-T3 [Thomomys bottae]